MATLRLKHRSKKEKAIKSPVKKTEEYPFDPIKKKKKSTKLKRRAAEFSSASVLKTLRTRLLEAFKTNIPSGYELDQTTIEAVSEFVLANWLNDMLRMHEGDFEYQTIDVAESKEAENFYKEKVKNA